MFRRGLLRSTYAWDYGLSMTALGSRSWPRQPVVVGSEGRPWGLRARLPSTRVCDVFMMVKAYVFLLLHMFLACILLLLYPHLKFLVFLRTWPFLCSMEML